MRKREQFMQRDENWERNERNSKIAGGLIVIIAGVLLLLKQAGMQFPHWLLSWEMILISIGFVMMIKHNFKKTSAYVLILIGGLFMLNDIVPNIIDPKFIWPTLIIIIGLSMIAKSAFPRLKNKQLCEADDLEKIQSDDYLKSSAFFSGITKKIVTKNFKGAKIASVFGGNEINLSQADFSGKVDIDITCVFGGVTLIVPSNWKIKSDLSSVFGGIEDQRPTMMTDLSGEEKIIVLKGTCFFGGIEILSYN